MSGWTRIEIGTSVIAGVVDVTATSGGERVGAPFVAADLAAAVEATCGVVLIPRTGLPTITTEPTDPRSGYVRVNDGNTQTLRSVESYDEDIRTAVALREYAKAHPPVDEVQVDAVAQILAANPGRSFGDIARKLIAAGVRIETTT